MLLRTIDVRSSSGFLGSRASYRETIPRGAVDVEHALDIVRPICDAVRDRGQQALAEFSERFDGIVPTSFRVPTDVLARCADELDPDVRAALVESVRRRRLVAEAEREPDSVVVEVAPGATVETRTVPVRRVGLYVPGGLAPLASSVLMNVVPAQVAGVDSLALATPPSRAHGGLPDPTILGLCHLLGVDEVYAVGGAQAIAMFAYGVPGLCEPVDLVTGPGNIFVVAAKRLLRGLVGIDSEAGPTEIMVLADATADPAFVAADLISQAEHDPMAGSVLVTDDRALADAVQVQLIEQVAALGGPERIETALGGPQSAVVLVDDLDQAVTVANAYGAEHLEIHTADASAVARRIRNAGAIFVGPYAPVPLGDYSAGSTHVLPTSGTAAHSSGLTVRSFCKTVHVIDYDEAALAAIGPSVEVFAAAEQLPGHAAAITVRTRGENR